jgi:hypothetical protein
MQQFLISLANRSFSCSFGVREPFCQALPKDPGNNPFSHTPSFCISMWVASRWRYKPPLVIAPFRSSLSYTLTFLFRHIHPSVRPLSCIFLFNNHYSGYTFQLGGKSTVVQVSIIGTPISDTFSENFLWLYVSPNHDFHAFGMIKIATRKLCSLLYDSSVPITSFAFLYAP